VKSLLTIFIFLELAMLEFCLPVNLIADLLTLCLFCPIPILTLTLLNQSSAGGAIPEID
jgi:hypothetical protein